MGRVSILCCCLLLLAWPATLHAQDCDILVANATWSTHPDPDSIWVHFAPDVITNDPTNPRQYDFSLVIRFNGVQVDDHPLQLRWAHGVGCPADCDPAVICEEKEWSYKGIVFRDQSRCTRDAQNQCGCPPLGQPVPHRKPIPKPQGAGIIEVELVPLSLVSCGTLINPSNDRFEFPFPGNGPNPSLPGFPPVAVVLLLAGLLVVGLLGIRARAKA
jgi:hypothetical protein